MIQLPVTVQIEHFDEIAAALKQLVQIQSAARFTFQLKFSENLMPTYKSDRPDFDFTITINATDSEGNVIPDAPIPAGHTLQVVSDNPAAFEVIQDAGDPKLVHAHVGGPNADGTPSQANVNASLFDPANNLVAAGVALVAVTVGDPTTITEIDINLPE